MVCNQNTAVREVFSETISLSLLRDSSSEDQSLKRRQPEDYGFMPHSESQRPTTSIPPSD